MTALYEISQEIEQLLNESYDDEGNANPQAMQKLEETQLEMRSKIIAVSSYIENLESQKASIKVARDAMKKREDSLEKRIASLNEYLLFNMERSQVLSISCPYFDIKIKKNAPHVEVSNEDLIPGEYKNIKTITTLNKAKMRADMLVGVIIDGAHLESNSRIEIK